MAQLRNYVVVIGGDYDLINDMLQAEVTVALD